MKMALQNSPNSPASQAGIRNQTTDEEARSAVKREIARVLVMMEGNKSIKKKVAHSLILSRLWNLVYPTAGENQPD